jgi:hypothetical protein
MPDEFLRNNKFVLHQFRHTERYEYEHWVDQNKCLAMATVRYAGIKIDFERQFVSRYWLIKPTMTAADGVDLKKVWEAGSQASSACKHLISEDYYPRSWMQQFIDVYDNELTLID